HAGDGDLRDSGPRLAERITHDLDLVRSRDRLEEGFSQGAAADIVQLKRRKRELGLNCSRFEHGAARAGSTCAKKLAEWCLVAGKDDAAFASKMFANGAGQDFDSFFGETEFRRANHQAGNVFCAGW